MKPLERFCYRIKKQSRNLQMPRRFLLYYLLLIFLPMLIFFAWYSRGLVRERQNEQRYEYQLMLDHSAEFFGSFLQQSNFVYDTLQSNTALLNMMENNLYSVSEEVITYQTQIKPTISSILSANSVIDEIFIYRHLPSRTLNNAGMIYYFQDMGDFTYPGKILEALEISGAATTIWLWTKVRCGARIRIRFLRSWCFFTTFTAGIIPKWWGCWRCSWT